MKEDLKTFVIDMTAESGNRFRLNGEPIDISNVQSMDIHIESGIATIKTVELKVFSFGN